MTRSVLFLVVCSVALSAVAQVVLKLGMAMPSVQSALAGRSGSEIIVTIISSWRIMLGLCIYFFSALVWLLVLAKIDVSLAYPFVGLGFILTALLGWLVRGEELSPGRISGTALIVAGVILVARSS